MGFTYSNIFRSARRYTRRVSRVSFSSTSSANSAKAHKQVAVTVLILLIVFLMCWLPYFMYAVLVSANKALSTNRVVRNLGKAAYWCVFASSGLNPYIYGFRNPQFRKEFQFIFCWLCPCVRWGLRMRGCSSTTGSKGSWDGSGFGYKNLRRPSTPCATPKGRLSVDFAPFPQNDLQKFEMLALQAKFSKCSSDSRYCIQDENGAFCVETGTSDENLNNTIDSNDGKDKDDSKRDNDTDKNNSSDNYSNNNFFSIDGTRCHGDFKRSFTIETDLHHITSDQGSFTADTTLVQCSNINQGFHSENYVENSTMASTDDRANEIKISRSSTHVDSPDVDEVARNLDSSLSEERLTPTRPRGWSLRTLGARLKLGWVESAL